MSKNKNNEINIIYHDENIQFEGMDIVDDCYVIQNDLKCTLILSNDLINLNLLINHILKTSSKCKFFLIINGSSAENTIKFIRKNNYTSLFIKACLYTKIRDKYAKIKDNNQDFIGEICIKVKEITNYINNIVSKMKEPNEKFNINKLINYYNYKAEYNVLHKKLSLHYGEDKEEIFSYYFSELSNLLKTENFPDETKKEIIKCFEEFSFKNKDNYEKKIITFLKYDSFSRYINTQLMKKDQKIYSYIGYFVSNLMNSLVEYGKKEAKGINDGQIFYFGMELDIVDVLEFLKNRYYYITFPFFLRMATNKKFAELLSKKNSKKKGKEVYSVLMQIDYLYDDGFEPCVFDLRQLAQYPDEEEYILLPFTFLYIKKITIDSKNLFAEIHLQIAGKEETLEFQIQAGKSIRWDEKQHIMIAK